MRERTADKAKATATKPTPRRSAKAAPLTAQQKALTEMAWLTMRPYRKGETKEMRIAKFRVLARKATGSKREYRQFCREMGLPREGK